MLNRCREKLVEDLSLMEVTELDELLADVDQKRREREKEELHKAFEAFNDAWEALDELGYAPFLHYGVDREIPIDCIVWRKRPINPLD